MSILLLLDFYGIYSVAKSFVTVKLKIPTICSFLMWTRDTVCQIMTLPKLIFRQDRTNKTDERGGLALTSQTIGILLRT